MFFGVDFFDPQTAWINWANLSLGVGTVLCILAVCWGVVRDVLDRVAARVALPHGMDDHSFAVQGLGLTMADGGERLDDEDEEDSDK